MNKVPYVIDKRITNLCETIFNLHEEQRMDMKMDTAMYNYEHMISGCETKIERLRELKDFSMGWYSPKSMKRHHLTLLSSIIEEHRVLLQSIRSNTLDQLRAGNLDLYFDNLNDKYAGMEVLFIEDVLKQLHELREEFLKRVTI